MKKLLFAAVLFLMAVNHNRAQVKSATQIPAHMAR